MKLLSIKLSAALSLSACLLFSAPLLASAQEDGTNGPPKVLVIQREYLKPGKSGSVHAKSESAFVQAMTAAKSTSHYFAMTSMSGPSRSLYFAGYPSFAAWEKDNMYIRKNASLSAALDRASIADGELLTQYEQSVLSLREDLSLNMGNLVGMRYMEISHYEVIPGHNREFNELVKLYVEGYKKAVPDAHWVTFELTYGVADGPVYIAISPLKSLAETDSGMGDSKKFADSMGPEAMKKLHELYLSCVRKDSTNLFELDPKTSYPPDTWIKAEPDFWKPRMSGPAMKTVSKPAPSN